MGKGPGIETERAVMLMTTRGSVLVLGTVIAAGLGAPLLIQHSAEIKTAEMEKTLQRQAQELADLSAENRRLSSPQARANSPAPESGNTREILRLRGEISQLRQTLAELNEPRRQRQTAPEQPTKAASPDPGTVQAYWCQKHSWPLSARAIRSPHCKPRFGRCVVVTGTPCR